MARALSSITGPLLLRGPAAGAMAGSSRAASPAAQDLPRRHYRCCTALLICICAVAGAEPRFSEQGQAAGLGAAVFVPLPDSLPEMASGGVVADFDGDGWQDLFFVSGGGAGPDRLYFNNGDGTFTDRAAEAGLAMRHRGLGATAGDYDGDGWIDLFVVSFGPADLPAPEPGRLRLYRNNGDGTFAEVAAQAGVAALPGEEAAGMGAAFGDYDLDGDLDLAVTAWGTPWRDDLLIYNPNPLFRNNGDGTFTEVSRQAGVFSLRTLGFAPLFADMDGDRYPELLIAADLGTSKYYRNNGDGTFTERTAASGTGRDANGMGSTVGDFDGDGLLDWYVTSVYGELRETVAGTGNMLYLNRGGHIFTESAQSAGVGDGGWGWGAVAVDLDHDGRLDIVTTNGWEQANGAGVPEWEEERTYLFRNHGDLIFSEVSAPWGLHHTGQGRGLVHFDYDNDGDQDLAIFTKDERLSLFRNDLAPEGRHWLRILLDTNARPDLAPHGIGARVVVRTSGPEAPGEQSRYLSSGGSYLTSSELSAHFGLGGANRVAELRVEWPDGSLTVLRDLPADQTITIRP